MEPNTKAKRAKHNRNTTVHTYRAAGTTGASPPKKVQDMLY